MLGHSLRRGPDIIPTVNEYIIVTRGTCNNHDNNMYTYFSYVVLMTDPEVILLFINILDLHVQCDVKIGLYVHDVYMFSGDRVTIFNQRSDNW